MRLRQGRGIVDAVARHGHDASLRLQLLDDGRLLLGQHFRLDAVDAQFFCHRLRRDAIVAGEHDDLHAFFMQCADRVRGGSLDRIGHADQARRLAVDG